MEKKIKPRYNPDGMMVRLADVPVGSVCLAFPDTQSLKVPFMERGGIQVRVVRVETRGPRGMQYVVTQNGVLSGEMAARREDR